MKIFGYTIERSSQAKPPLTSGQVRPPKLSARARQTIDTADESFSLANKLFAYTAPEDANSAWRRLDLDSDTLTTMNPAELVELMVDVSPEISKAVWDLLRFCNPGYECDVLRGEEEDARGTAVVNDFIALLDEYYGSFDVVIGRLFTGAFLRGAFLGELVLDNAGRKMVDLATPDPHIIRFDRVIDEQRGLIWEIGQNKGGKFVSLAGIPTIRYIPIDPMPGKPYGRSFIAPAIFSSLFLIGLLHDLRRVVSQQGYPRLDLVVNLERLLMSMPDEYKGDDEKMNAWITEAITQVANLYGQLEPDDAYVHTDVVEVHNPVGAVNIGTMSAFDSLIGAVERISVRGLKTMPLLFGLTGSTSETQANREWEIYVAGIKSLQHNCEKLLERLLTVGLEAQGIQATVKFRFAELRASEMLRDAMTEQILIQNERAKYDNGWISQNEAAEAVTGSDADTESPRDAGASGVTFDPAMTLDGSERKAAINAIREARNSVEELLAHNKAISLNGHKV